MSLVDDVFGSLPAPLIDQWGIPAIYIKASQHQNYDPESGTVLGVNTEIPVRVLITKIELKQCEGLYQQRMVKIMIAASYFDGYYPKSTDSIRYTEDGVQRTAKICDQKQYRGDNPIMHILIGEVS